MSCGLDSYRLEPDALAEFAADEKVVVAVEVISSSKPVSILAKRLPRYAALARDGRLDALWVATPATTSAHAVQELLSQHVLDGWARVLPRDHLIARPVHELPERVIHDGPKGPVGANTPKHISPAVSGDTRTLPRQ